MEFTCYDCAYFWADYKDLDPNKKFYGWCVENDMEVREDEEICDLFFSEKQFKEEERGV